MQGDQGCVRQRRFDVYIKPLTLVDPETSVFLIYTLSGLNPAALEVLNV